MKILLDKSNESCKASKLLQEEEFYSSSIHCSYYSIIQLMRHIIFNVHNQDEDLFDGKLAKEGKGSHNYLIGFIRQKLIDAKLNFKEFSHEVKDLKDLRKCADYKQLKMCTDDCRKALSLANNLRNSLQKIYRL